MSRIGNPGPATELGANATGSSFGDRTAPDTQLLNASASRIYLETSAPKVTQYRGCIQHERE